MSSGHYFDNHTRWFVSSAPRDRDMKGEILIFKYGADAMKSIITVTGTQTGEYFGASVTSCDVDNDGKDEIIVGAPTWSKDGDEGRIYIISIKKNSNVSSNSKKKILLDRKNSHI